MAESFFFLSRWQSFPKTFLTGRIFFKAIVFVLECDESEEISVV